MGAPVAAMIIPLVALLSFGAPTTSLTDMSTCSEAKLDAILAALTEVNASAKAGKDADVTKLADLLGLNPKELAKITRTALTVPIDWECETRDAGGQFPCPMDVRCNRSTLQ